MTIDELVKTRANVETKQADLKKDTDALIAAINELTEKKDGPTPKDIKRLTERIYQAVNSADASRKLLRDYEYLLTDIMRQSKIDWPPKCDVGQIK